MSLFPTLLQPLLAQEADHIYAPSLLLNSTIETDKVSSSTGNNKRARSFPSQLTSLPPPSPSSLRFPPVQIDVSVNAPFAGKILEFLSSEEDTVTVGADLFVMEAGEGEACTSSHSILPSSLPPSFRSLPSSPNPS